MYTRSFGVVQLMYRPLRGFQYSVPNLVVSVQTFLFEYDTVHDVGKVIDKFQHCTVDIQDAMGLLTISTLPCCSFPNLPHGPLHFMHCR